MSNRGRPDWLIGHRPLSKQMNIRAELRRHARDPLDPLIRAVGGDDRVVVVQNEVSRYRDTYGCFYLALRRFLSEMSLASRWSRGPYYKLKYGGKYTAAERRLATSFNLIAPYLYLDFYNCLLWARMLLDRATPLARHFIDEPDKPSFTSFADHKKFFLRRERTYGRHEPYAEYVRTKTDWFDLPLKLVRDQFVVHASPKHQRFFGYTGVGHELTLLLILPDGDDPDKPFARVRDLTVSIPRTAREIRSFLRWYCRYGVNALAAHGVRRSAR